MAIHRRALPKVLYVCHNHASIRPGGVETYALELFEAVRARGQFEPLMLARARRPDVPSGIIPMEGHPGQFLFHIDHAGYDTFFGTPQDKSVLTRDFDGFLRTHRPDVVHFQHTLFLGYDLIRQTRNTLPDAAIVYTLHEYGPICHHNGQMVQTHDGAPCAGSSPDRCHRCFPDSSPEAFWLRKRFIESQFRLVDQFIAPSRFLRERFVEWGIPGEKVRYEEYGRQPQAGAARVRQATGGGRRIRNRFGFFGQLTPFKGVDLLLRAMARVRGEAELVVHGANLEFQSKPFQREFQALLDETRGDVTFAGAYDPAGLSRLMAEVDWVVVPSIWWENSPLVIQEAFLHGRPVICSDIGGMAEKVTHGVNGLHFRAGDVESLASTLRTAAGAPALWEQYSQAVPDVYPMAAHADLLDGMYRGLMAGAAGRS